MAINFLSSIDVAGTVSVSSVSNDNSSYTGILVWDGGLLKYRTKSQLLTDIGGDINNYVSSISFNTTNGILSLPRTGLSTLTVDLDGRYVDLTTNQTIAGIKTFSTRVKGNVGTPLDTFMMPQNPEGKHISAPWFFNDMAYARLKGATINVVVNGGSSPSTANIDAMFDASTGFWSMSTAGVTSVVITMSSLPKTMYYGTYMGLTFGNINWIAKDITLESYYNGQWNTLETYTNQTEEFVIKSYNSSGNAQSQLRYTLSNFNTTSMRIVSLFAYNYNATGMPSLYATLNGFSMYGQVDMNQNKIIDLPTPTATTDAANKAYVDAQVGTADTLSEVLALGNTSGTNDISMLLGQKIYFNNNGENITSTLNGDLELNSRTDLRIKANNNSTAGVGLEFWNGGSEKMRVNLDGNVGIGTTSPGQKLHVVGEGKIQGNLMVGSSGDVAGAAGQLHIKGPNAQVIVLEDTDNANLVVRLSAEETVGFKIEDTTNSNVLLFGDEDGNVGIGTTSPGHKLEVFEAGNSLSIGDNTNAQTYMSFANTRTMMGYSGANALIQGGSGKGIQFNVNNDTFNSGEAMRITSAGNVGIGTTNPATKLDVRGDITITNANGGNPTDAGSLYFTESPGVWGSTQYGFRINQQGTSNYLNFQSANTTTVRDILTLARDTGNVGIGTTSPSQLLVVAGNIRVTGAYYDSNNSPGTSGQILSSTVTGVDWIDNAHIPSPAPATPGNITSTIVGETIEIEFDESTTSNIDYYQVWSSDDGGDFGIIAQITPTDFSSTMTVVDTTFVTGGTMSYRVYAVKSGVYSSPGTTSIVYTVGTLDVTDMTVINLNTAYYIQYEKPASRFIDHIEIYMDSQTTQAALNRSNANIVYSGQNPSYMRSVGVSSNFHQFWVEVVTT